LGVDGAELKMLRPIQIAMIAGTLAAYGGLAYAGEHVMLSNGFAVDCDHHATVDGRMRLYLNAGETNFIVLKPEEVSGIEIVPDRRAEELHHPGPANDTDLAPADLREMLADAGQARNLDVDLLASVVTAESGGRVNAVSKAGAQGLMQLMPTTATDLGVKNTFEPGENVRGGSAYLDSLLTRYHENLGLALAAYNAGPAAVDKYHGMPPYHETQVYVARVIHEFNRRVRLREAQARQVTAKTPAAE
jgi:Transglycosylase SLT domain